MSKVYKAIVTVADRYVPGRFRPLWEHPAGPKTIFFWAPAFKWGLVIAGLGDLCRPGDKISIYQSAALTTLGTVRAGHYLNILPVNYNQLGLVIACWGDLSRPAEKLSLRQSAALAATGAIWSRYSLVIKPVNYSLFAVNVFVGISGIYQVIRAYRYQISVQDREAKAKETKSK